MVLSKEELISVLRNEARILSHLCTKVKPEMLDYRPTPGQRSTLELLRYLTVMGPVLVPSIHAGTFLTDAWTAQDAQAKAMDFHEVEKSLAGLGDFYSTAVGHYTDEDFRGEVDLFGSKASRGVMLVNLVVSGHAAYRTQLFCYLKACGREELSTMNLWGGMDAPPKG